MDGRTDLTRLQNDFPRLANEYDALWFKAYTDIEAKEPLLREQLLNWKTAYVEFVKNMAMSNSFLEPPLMSLNRVLMKGQL